MKKIFCEKCGAEKTQGLQVWYCDCNKKKKNIEKSEGEDGYCGELVTTVDDVKTPPTKVGGF